MWPELKNELSDCIWQPFPVTITESGIREIGWAKYMILEQVRLHGKMFCPTISTNPTHSEDTVWIALPITIQPTAKVTEIKWAKEMVFSKICDLLGIPRRHTSNIQF